MSIEQIQAQLHELGYYLKDSWVSSRLELNETINSIISAALQSDFKTIGDDQKIFQVESQTDIWKGKHILQVVRVRNLAISSSEQLKWGLGVPKVSSLSSPSSRILQIKVTDGHDEFIIVERRKINISRSPYDWTIPGSKIQLQDVPIINGSAALDSKFHFTPVGGLVRELKSAYLLKQQELKNRIDVSFNMPPKKVDPPPFLKLYPRKFINLSQYRNRTGSARGLQYQSEKYTLALQGNTDQGSFDDTAAASVFSDNTDPQKLVDSDQSALKVGTKNDSDSNASRRNNTHNKNKYSKNRGRNSNSKSHKGHQGKRKSNRGNNNNVQQGRSGISENSNSSVQTPMRFNETNLKKGGQKPNNKSPVKPQGSQKMPPRAYPRQDNDSPQGGNTKNSQGRKSSYRSSNKNKSRYRKNNSRNKGRHNNRGGQNNQSHQKGPGAPKS